MIIKSLDPMEDIFVIKLAEIQHLAKKEFGRYLDGNEIKAVQKKIQFGLECWEDVVLYAIMDVINKSNEN